MLVSIKTPGEGDLGHIGFRTQTDDEESELASFISSKDFVLSMERVDRNHFELRPKYVGEKVATPVGFDPAIEARADFNELRTLCQELEIPRSRTDKTADLIIKLKKYYAERSDTE